MLTPKSMTSNRKHNTYTPDQRSEPRSQQAILRRRREETCLLAFSSCKRNAASFSRDLSCTKDIPKIKESGSCGSPVCCISASRPPRMLEDVVPSTSCSTHAQDNNTRTRLTRLEVTQYCVQWSQYSAIRAKCVPALRVAKFATWNFDPASRFSAATASSSMPHAHATIDCARSINVSLDKKMSSLRYR
jgi:hypothetical protein